MDFSLRSRPFFSLFRPFLHPVNRGQLRICRFQVDSRDVFGHNAFMLKQDGIKVPFIILLVAAIFFTAFFFSLNAKRYQARFAFEWGDEAVHNQLAWRTFHVAPFTSTLKGDQVFDQHFRPIWLLVALAYLVVPSIYSWYFLLALFFAATAVVFFFWTLHKGNDPWAALLYSLVILFYPPLHQLAIGVYDPEKLSVLFLSLMLLAFAYRRLDWFVAFVVLSLCCKEIVGFPIFMFALALALLRKPKRYWVIAGAIAVAWVAIAFVVIIPTFMQVGYGSKYFPQLLGADCESAGCVIRYALFHPADTLGVIFSPEHLKILAKLILPLGAMILFNPGLLIPAMAPLAMILAVPGPLLIHQHHWFAPALPFLFAGSILGALRLSNRIAGADEKKRTLIFRIIPGCMLVLCIGFSLWGGFVGVFHDDDRDDRSFNDLTSVFDRRIYTADKHDRVAWSLIRQVPREAKVTANYDLMAPLAARKTIREFGRNGPDYDYFDFDYILINLKDLYFGAGHDVRLHPDDLDLLAKMVLSGEVQVLYSDRRFFFGKKMQPPVPTDDPAVTEAVQNIARAKFTSAKRLANPGVQDMRD